jgi:hypothetical protein
MVVRRCFAAGWTTAAAMLLFSACSGKVTAQDGGAPATAAPPSESEFLFARPAAARDLFVRCCTQLYGVTLDASQLTGDPFATDLSHLVYDPALGADCLARLRAVTGSCTMSVADADALERSCFAYRGTLPAGAGGCSSDKQCAAPDGTQAVCLMLLSPTTGAMLAPPTCALLERGTEGDACFGYTTPATTTGLHFCDPADGLFCAEPGVCQRRHSQGEACLSLSSIPANPICADGLYCAYPLPPTAAVAPDPRCAPLAPLGAPCDFDNACLSGICDHAANVCIEAEPVPSASKCGVDPSVVVVVPTPGADGGPSPWGDAGP